MSSDDLLGPRTAEPWWREYADADVPADPEEIPAYLRTAVAEEDRRKSPYWPEHDPPELPEEAREAGVERADLLPEGE